MDQYIGSCLAKIDDTTALMKCCTQNKLFLALSLHLLSFSSRNYNLFASCHFNENHIHIYDQVEGKDLRIAALEAQVLVLGQENVQEYIFFRILKTYPGVDISKNVEQTT